MVVKVVLRPRTPLYWCCHGHCYFVVLVESSLASLLIDVLFSMIQRTLRDGPSNKFCIAWILLNCSVGHFSYKKWPSPHIIWWVPFNSNLSAAGGRWLVIRYFTWHKWVLSSVCMVFESHLMSKCLHTSVFYQLKLCRLIGLLATADSSNNTRWSGGPGVIHNLRTRAIDMIWYILFVIT